jgi:hypothetical protein
MGYAATFVGVKRQNIIVVPALFSTGLKLGNAALILPSPELEAIKRSEA